MTDHTSDQDVHVEWNHCNYILICYRFQDKDILIKKVKLSNPCALLVLNWDGCCRITSKSLVWVLQ